MAGMLSAVIVPLWLLAASTAYGQDEAATAEATAAAEAAAAAAAAEEETPESKVKNVLDDRPMPSARASGMGGALVTSADDLDAAFHNPAGIGGLNWGKKGTPWIRKLYFPHISVGANENSQDLNKEFKDEDGAGDSAVGKAIVDANAGKRQYARVNALAGMVFGRTMIIPINDLQVAATSKDDGTGGIDAKYRATSGGGVGFSAQTPDGSFSLGYFGYLASRTEVEGTFLYEDIINAEKRKEVLKDGTTKYEGTGHNTGIIWRLAKTAAPTLGISLRDAGGTKYKAKTEGADSVMQKQDLSIGFSLAPQLGKSGANTFLFALQADRLSDDEVAFTKKYKLGVELSLGGFGSYATFALRGGYNYAGGSGGLYLNLGLIGFEAAVESVDIGAGNEKVIERRGMGSIFVNVAEF